MKLVKSIAYGIIPLLVAGVAKAQYSTTPSEVGSAEVVAASGVGLIALGIGVVIILSLLGLIFLGLWIWALVDVLKRDFADENKKKTWMWLVILSWPVPVVISFIPGIGFLSSLFGLAGIVIIIVYLASIRKQGTKRKATKAMPKPEEKK